MSLIALLATLALAGPIRAEVPTPARNAVTLWLEMIDQERYGEAWDRASPLLQENVERDLWIARHQAMRFADGPLRERAQLHQDIYRHIPDGPEGQYLITVFSARFGSALRDKGEVVSLEYRDGQWLPVGYFRPDQIPPLPSQNQSR